MSGPSSVERQLQELQELEELAESLGEPDTREHLRRHLASKNGVVVAKAAKLVMRRPDEDLVPDLLAAFRRFMVDPARSDKGCLAKLALTEALLALEHPDEEVFRRGIEHVQLEPTWGGQADTAAPLRALCALGLVQVGALGVLDDLAVLLADPEPDARIGAARALGHCGSPATPLLRFKALTGDEQPLVLAECLSALMSIAPDESFDFVAALVDPERIPTATHAAMALGESRHPRAYRFLRETWEEAWAGEFRQSLLLPVAMTRDDDAPRFLLSVLGSGNLGDGTAAIAALAIYRGDPDVRSRAAEAVAGPHRMRLLALLEKALG